jgi:hypothetical protein
VTPADAREATIAYDEIIAVLLEEAKRQPQPEDEHVEDDGAA